MASFAPDPSMMGGPPMDPSMMGPPSGGSGVDLLKQAIELLKMYADQETEEDDIAQAMQFASGIQKLIAKQQGEADQALGVSGPAKFLRRTSG